MNSRLPGSSAYGIFQARILEWVAISSSREPSQSSLLLCSLSSLSLLHCRSQKANAKTLIVCSICTLGVYYVHICEYTQKQIHIQQEDKADFLQVSTDLGIRDKIISGFVAVGLSFPSVK